MSDDQFDERLGDIMSGRLGGARSEQSDPGARRPGRTRGVVPRPTPRTADPMRVVCTDGTVVRCRYFEVSGAGLTLFGDPGDGSTGEETTTGGAAGEADEAPESDPPADRTETSSAPLAGFVPFAQLRYVLPGDVTPEERGDASSVDQFTPSRKFDQSTPRNAGHSRLRSDQRPQSQHVRPQSQHEQRHPPHASPRSQSGQHLQSQSGQYPQSQSGQYPQSQSGQYPQSQSGQYPQPQFDQQPRSQSDQHPQPQSGQQPRSQSDQLRQPQSARSAQGGALLQSQHGQLAQRREAQRPRQRYVQQSQQRHTGNPQSQYR